MNPFSWLSGVFNRSTENRSGGFPTSVNYSLNDPKLADLLSLNSGPISVSEETALSLAVVYRCVDVLSSSFASLPWELYQFDGTNTTPALTHPVRPLLSRPHRLQTSYIWRKTMLTHALLWGNGYARIIRNGVQRPTQLKLYHPTEVNVQTDIWRDTVSYQFPDVPGSVGPEDVIHLKIFSVDGIIGRSVIRQAAESFKLPMQSRRFSSKIFENGARPAAIIKSKLKLGLPTKQNIRDSWFSNYGGENQAGKTAVLDEGMEYEKVGMSPVDTQLLELMNLSDEQICSLFGVPQHMAGILRQSTNNNIEHQGLEYLSYGLKPHVENFQQEFDYKVLRVQEQGFYGTRFDTDALQLVDLNAKKEWYRTLRQAGILNANEIRDELGYNPYEGGDAYLIQGAMAKIDSKTGMPQLANMPAPGMNGKPVNGQKLPVN